MPKCYQAKGHVDNTCTLTCFHRLWAKMIAGQVSQNLLCETRGERDYSQVAFNQALEWYLTQEVNTGCKVWCYVMSQKWTCGQEDQTTRPPPSPPLLAALTSSPHFSNDASNPCMAWRELSVCVCVHALHTYRIYMHTYSHQSSPSHPNARPDHVQRLSSNPLRRECACW